MNDYSKRNFYSCFDDEMQKRRFYLILQGKKIEVSKEVFYVCYNSYRKELRDNRRNEKYGLISYDQTLNDHGFTLLDVIGKEEDIIEKIHINTQIEKVLYAINELSDEDKDLITELLFHEKKEKELAEQYKVSKQAINKRKQRIINKIKEKIQN